MFDNKENLRKNISYDETNKVFKSSDGATAAAHCRLFVDAE